MSQKGSGSAKLHDIFVQTIGTLRTWANDQGQSMIIRKAAGSWFVPGDFYAIQTSVKAIVDCHSSSSDYWPGDPLDIKGIANAFDRSEINENYMDIHKNMETAGTTGSAGVLKQQLDYVASAERAYRLRHLTPVRCVMHHTVRRTGHAHEQGVFATILDDVVDNLKVSSRPAPPPEPAAAPSSSTPVASPGGAGPCPPTINPPGTVTTAPGITLPATGGPAADPIV